MAAKLLLKTARRERGSQFVRLSSEEEVAVHIH